MYTVGKWIGSGAFGDFFRIRGEKFLGVKVLKTGSAKKIKEEFEKLKILHELGIPVPYPRSVSLVKFPDYFKKTLAKQKIPIREKRRLEELTSQSKLGIIMEFVDQDLKMISSKRLEYYKKKELEKVKRLGIIANDTSYRNILWSQKHAKFYFCDVAFWEIPYDQIENRGKMSRFLRWLFRVK